MTSENELLFLEALLSEVSGELWLVGGAGGHSPQATVVFAGGRTEALRVRREGVPADPADVEFASAPAS